MSDVTHGVVTPAGILTSILGFIAGAISMAYDPFFLVSLLAIALCILALQSAARVRHHIVQGVLRIFAILGIMGALGGIMLVAFPGLGVTPA